jgi:hypothetical protein
MSRFFFDRRPPSEPLAEPTPPTTRPDDRALKAVLDVQSITASAIFAMLVGKGVLTAAEAAAHMAEIAEALELDVRSPQAAHAAATLRSYAGALSAAAE